MKSVAISAPNRSLKIKPYLARKPIHSNAFPNLYMPVFQIAVDTVISQFPLISVKPHSDAILYQILCNMCSIQASLQTQAKPSAPQSQISSWTVYM